jgi:hypothetical protein
LTGHCLRRKGCTSLSFRYCRQKCGLNECYSLSSQPLAPNLRFQLTASRRS